MTTRALNGGGNGRSGRQVNLSSNRDPGATRGREVLLEAPAVGETVGLSKLGADGSGKGTYLFTGTITNAGDGVAEQLLFQVDDGTNDNRFYLRNPSANETITLVRLLAGAAATGSPGSVTDATQFKVAMAILGDGSARASLNGGAVASVSGGPTTGLLTVRFGESANGSSTLTGSLVSLRVQPGLAVPDAELQRLST